MKYPSYWKLKPIRIKPIRIHFNLDTDRDRVKDYKDCRPFDTNLHKIKPSQAMQERIENLPIYVSRGLGHPMYPLLSKQAEKKAKEARIRALSAIKRYPSIVGEIERKQPPTVVFSESPCEGTHGSTEVESKRVILYGKSTENQSKEEYLENAVEFIKDNYPEEDWDYHFGRLEEVTKRTCFLEDSLAEQEKKTRYSTAKTTFHELEHVKQLSTLRGKRKVLEESTNIYPSYKRPTEQAADIFAEKKMKEREKKQKVPPVSYSKILQLE